MNDNDWLLGHTSIYEWATDAFKRNLLLPAEKFDGYFVSNTQLCNESLVEHLSIILSP
jgi:hypothetical protein